ncbi:MAG: putative oxidoreductase, partial [Friedmanniella sp.]|nr:putative oxidoreductase [Friedmanniella sp.]
AGTEVVSVCESADLSGWVRHVGGALRVPAKAREGLEYVRVLLQHRIPYRRRTVVTAIHGVDEVEAVTVARVDAQGAVRAGTERRLEVDLVALGWGFTPSLELVVATGAQTRLDVDGSLVAVVDEEQRSTVRGVYVAGEATGVGGAVLAVLEGELAALAAAQDRGRSVPVMLRRRRQRAIGRARAFARTMHLAHPVPPQWPDWLTEDTTVCRCEEVTYSDLCRVRDELGAVDARTVKLLARPGMGWCQGRVCGFAAAHLAAAGQGRTVTAEDLRPMAKRPLAAPVSLAELAHLTDVEDLSRPLP